MDNINGFTTFDGDKLPNNSWTLMTYPHMGERFAWILMNGDDMTMDSSQKGFGMGHNSLQAMHAVSNVHDYTAYDSESDDWLISPELSGKAQTIEFWGNSEVPHQRISISMLPLRTLTQQACARIAFTLRSSLLVDGKSIAMISLRELSTLPLSSPATLPVLLLMMSHMKDQLSR